MTAAKKTTPAMRTLSVVSSLPEAAAADDEVGLVGEHRGEQLGHLGGVVLAVGVER